MADQISDELTAEIESFRAELQARAAEHARSSKTTSLLDLPQIDVSELELPGIKALISQRYANARYERRLERLERKVAEIEARNG